MGYLTGEMKTGNYLYLQDWSHARNQITGKYKFNPGSIRFPFAGIKKTGFLFDSVQCLSNSVPLINVPIRILFENIIQKNWINHPAEKWIFSGKFQIYLRASKISWDYPLHNAHGRREALYSMSWQLRQVLYGAQNT